MSSQDIKVNDSVEINPTKTGLGEWISGRVIEVENKGILGTCITMISEDRETYFGEIRWFRKVVSTQNEVTINREKGHQIISSHFSKEGGSSYKNLLEISGKYLLENNLAEAWAVSRGKDINEITEEWTD